jgi:hypothetical protein
MNWRTLPLLILTLLLGLLVWQAWRVWLHRWRLRRLAQFECPSWMLQSLRQTYPQLRPQDLKQVQDGLRQFLRICLQARGRQVAMPSQVVDALWHALILDTRLYQHLCRQVFGRVLHHTPAQAMSTRDHRNEPLRRAWRLACRDEGLNPQNPEPPKRPASTPAVCPGHHLGHSGWLSVCAGLWRQGQSGQPLRQQPGLQQQCLQWQRQWLQ